MKEEIKLGIEPLMRLPLRSMKERVVLSGPNAERREEKSELKAMSDRSSEAIAPGSHPHSAYGCLILDEQGSPRQHDTFVQQQRKEKFELTRRLRAMPRTFVAL